MLAACLGSPTATSPMSATCAFVAAERSLQPSQLQELRSYARLSVSRFESRLGRKGRMRQASQENATREISNRAFAVPYKIRGKILAGFRNCSSGTRTHGRSTANWPTIWRLAIKFRMNFVSCFPRSKNRRLISAYRTRFRLACKILRSARKSIQSVRFDARSNFSGDRNEYRKS